MKRRFVKYPIKANMLGPAFNLSEGDESYCIDACVFNSEDAVFERVDDLHACVGDIEYAADLVLYYLQDEAVESVFVNGKVEFDASDFWSKAEVISKLLDEA